MEILLFGGTTEGRELAAWLDGQGCAVTLCVATQYGASLAATGPRIRVQTGRLDEQGMGDLMKSRPYACVVDATHPYAAEVSRTIRAAAEGAELPCHRLIREGAPRDEGWLHAADPQEAAQILETLPGNILLTTGSKNLDAFALPALLGRVYPRVLPSAASLERCLALGFPPGHILCMQGPFSQALNEALLDQYAIGTLVSKASGGAGGFWEKAAAARARGAAFLVIDRPAPETGRNYEEMLAFLTQLYKFSV